VTPRALTDQILVKKEENFQKPNLKRFIARIEVEACSFELSQKMKNPLKTLLQLVLTRS
jgi:hypothetical protein